MPTREELKDHGLEYLQTGKEFATSQIESLRDVLADLKVIAANNPNHQLGNIINKTLERKISDFCDPLDMIPNALRSEEYIPPVYLMKYRVYVEQAWLVLNGVLDIIEENFNPDVRASVEAELLPHSDNITKLIAGEVTTPRVIVEYKLALAATVRGVFPQIFHPPQDQL